MRELLVKAISLVLIIVIGYTIKCMNWVSAGDFPIFSKIVLRITLPCALITSFNEFDIALSLLFLSLIGFVVNCIQQLTGYLINRKNSGKELAFSLINIGSYNIGAFAIPYISGFVGSPSIVYASLFDVGSAISAAGIGYGWAMSAVKENEKSSIGSFIKSMFKSPVFDTYLFLLVFRLMHLKMPAGVISFTSVVGSANTFLAMLMVGIGLELHLDRRKLKKAFQYLAIRYCFATIFTIVAVGFIPFPRDIKIVLCMLFFSPIAAMATGFTDEAKCDLEASTFMTSVSILVGIVAMPLIFMAMG